MATSDPISHRTDLEQGLDKILVAASEVASSESTRDYRQHAIITLCGEAKETLHELLAVFGRDGGSKEEQGEAVLMEEELERTQVISECVTDVGEKMTNLQKQVSTIDVHVTLLYTI